MTRARRRRLLLVGSLFVGLAATVTLMLSAFSQNLTYFYEPGQIAAGQAPADARFRVGGLVERGSVERPDQALAVRFKVADCDASVPVRFDGTLPDLFRPGQGVIAYGRLSNSGTFVADRVLAKHDQNYMSPEVAKTLNQKNKNSCMPANLQADR
ncbi:cytochrome c maturation protein CcmE [Salinisphaera orenii]|uniref:cytochrome c maturation protein CcmE n=1 Tax=Salinisphaera orenii TaxID=856731 RepID=UPI000DBE0963